jgi:hypothetical protein
MMSVIATVLEVSAASQVVVLAPLCVASALLAGRCSARINLALHILSLVLSLTMEAVLFHAIDTTQNAVSTGIVRYGYYLTVGPMLLALWAADGLLNRLAISHQARNRIADDVGSVGTTTVVNGSAAAEDVYPQLSRL